MTELCIELGHRPRGSWRDYAARVGMIRTLTEALACERLVVLHEPRKALRPHDVAADVPQRAPPAPTREVKTWFSLRVLDDVGAPIDDLDVALTQGTRSIRAKTNAAGVARWNDLDASFSGARLASEAALREKLRPRWSQARSGAPPEGPDVEKLSLGESDLSTSLEAEKPKTLVVVRALPRVRLVGMHFDTDKCFLRESAMRGIRRVAEIYRRFARGTLLVVGHTDTAGDDAYNLDLSLERANAVKAYLEDDVDAWDAWFGDDKQREKRWANPEIAHMMSALPCARDAASFQQWSNSTRGTALAVDGVMGPLSRKALIAAYMDLDGTTLPSGIGIEVHGCGEYFPADDVGDGVAEPENRRVEIFCFDDAVTPPVPGPKATQGELEYPRWKKQVTSDFRVDADPRADLRLRLTDHEKQPMAGAHCRLLQGDVVYTADDDGFVDIAVPVDARYIDVEWEPVEGHPFVHRVDIDIAPSAESDERCAARLRNLGFQGDSTQAMTSNYQAYFGTTPTGLLDDIRKELVHWHDGGARPRRGSSE